jgi:hypothetical protein
MHQLYHCSKFKTLTVKQRQEKVKQLGLCLNCFKSNLKTLDCNSNWCCNTIENLKKIQTALSKLFAKGNMKIRKWASNAPEILADLPTEDVEMKLGDDINQIIKAIKEEG